MSGEYETYQGASQDIKANVDLRETDEYFEQLKNIVIKRLAELAKESEDTQRMEDADLKITDEIQGEQATIDELNLGQQHYTIETSETIHDAEQHQETPAENANSLTSNDLIDRFIKNEPRISPRKEFYNPVDKSKFSNQDNEEIVSETLAKIHLQQGNNERQ